MFVSQQKLQQKDVMLIKKPTKSTDVILVCVSYLFVIDYNSVRHFFNKLHSRFLKEVRILLAQKINLRTTIYLVL